MEKLRNILDSRKGFFESATLPEIKGVQSEAAESECCDMNCGECDC